MIRKFKSLVNENQKSHNLPILTRGKVYREQMTFGGKKNKPSGYVMDDSGRWNRIGTEEFNKKFIEIWDKK